VSRLPRSTIIAALLPTAILGAALRSSDPGKHRALLAASAEPLSECTNEPSKYIPGMKAYQDPLLTVIDIPEVHDCQMLVEDAPSDPSRPANKEHVALVGLYSYEAMGSISASAFDNAWVRVALAYNWSTKPTGYASLGILPGANCVYLTAQGGWRGKLIPFADSRCPATMPASLPAKDLEVHRFKFSTLENDYPRAVRWDFDEQTSHSNYMLTKCGPAWCEIGPSGFTSRPAQTGDLRHTIKLWYDEQLLDQVITTSGGKSSVVSPMLGRFIPGLKLHGATLDDFRCNKAGRTCIDMTELVLPGETEAQRRARYGTYYWFRVGTIEIDFNNALDNAKLMYKKRYQLDNSGRAEVWVQYRKPWWWWPFNISWLPSSLNLIQWRVWFKPSTGSNPGIVKPEKRVDHASTVNGVSVHIVPGTTRWHWIYEDDTTWHACGDGCCSTDP
jgi:hypothetical protein